MPIVNILDITHSDTNLFIVMTVDARELQMKSNREVTFTPRLVNGADTVRFTPFTVAGRNRYYNALRNGADSPMLLRAGKVDSIVDYRAVTPWRPWMETARFEIATEERGCCSAPIGDPNAATALAQLDFTPKTYAPDYVYISPEAEAVKVRELKASAYIDFPVNKTAIYPDYRRNPEELAAIRATIDSVKGDPDITITSLSIKGYASPEGKYAANARLAEGRTNALADYVKKLYNFPAGIMTTSFEAEDWAGLREWIAKSTIEHRDSLLAIIDSPKYDGNPDGRDWALRSAFPAEGRMLLEEVYPALRHSDYTIDYTIRSYTTPEEIIAVMQTAPQKLSLQELYVAALSQEPGSDIYNEAFEIAVRMYPDDPVANLNAANAAMQRNDLRSAERYLAKAGASEEAEYARTILRALSGDRTGAAAAMRALKGNAAVEGRAKASAAEIDRLVEAEGRTWNLLEEEIINN